MIDAIAPGFTAETRQLTVKLVQILFPGVGALVMSAWCLGILNSHGRFLLSYSAPVLWNLFIIAGLLLFGTTQSLSNLVVSTAWCSVLGSFAQLLVQVPTVLRLTRRLHFSLDTASTHVRSVLINFVPVFISRGIVQLSAYVDNVLASLLPSGSVALLNCAQTIGLLPISLFGMSISAAELPAMSRAMAGDEKVVRIELAKRLNAAMRRMAFLVIPAAMSFFAFGDTLAGLLYQSGRFTHGDTLYVWALLIGSGIGLVASTNGRVCSSAFYALRDTRTPLRFAIVRVVLTIVLGYLSAFPIPKAFASGSQLGIGRFAGVSRGCRLDGVLVASTSVEEPRRLIFSSWQAVIQALEYGRGLGGSGLSAEALDQRASGRRRDASFFLVTGCSIWSGPGTCGFRKSTP